MRVVKSCSWNTSTSAVFCSYHRWQSFTDVQGFMVECCSGRNAPESMPTAHSDGWKMENGWWNINQFEQRNFDHFFPFLVSVLEEYHFERLKNNGLGPRNLFKFKFIVKNACFMLTQRNSVKKCAYFFALCVFLCRHSIKRMTKD